MTPGIAPTIPTLTEPTPTVDGQIGVTPGIWSPEPDQFSYQWYAKSPAGKTTQIPDATAQTYLVEGRWAGYKLRARVTSHLTDYADDSRYTAWSTTIAKAAFTNTPAPGHRRHPRDRPTGHCTTRRLATHPDEAELHLVPGQQHHMDSDYPDHHEPDLHPHHC